MKMYYSKEHEWIKIDNNNIGTFGITEYAVSQLGDITFVELPESGVETTQGEFLATIESVKAASDIYAPITGKIVSINTMLENAPEIINESPEENGWIAKIEISDETELNSLMNKTQYNDFIEGLN